MGCDKSYFALQNDPLYDDDDYYHCPQKVLWVGRYFILSCLENVADWVVR